jgi:hypothetical protein
MRGTHVTAISFTAALLVAAAAPGWAQSQLPRPGQLPPPGGQQIQRGPGPVAPQAQPGRGPQQQPQQAQPQQPPPPAPPAPYQAVAISAPPMMNDPSFEAFRKQLGDIAGRKDRAALARLVVAQGFFWESERGDRADKRKSGIDNLTAAIQLNARDGSGWEALAGYASDATAMPLPQRKEVLCAPSDPVFTPKELEDLAKATGTEEGDWGYPTQPGLEVRAGPQPNSPVIEKLGMHFVRVMMEDGPGAQPPSPQTQPPGRPGSPQAGPQGRPQAAPPPPPTLRIVTPSGKVGYVPAEALSPLGNDQLCYVKDASGAWKIAGFIGGEQ